ncbi:guanylate kinase [Asbolus verrucosus]|uniref:guanylate kinase n=1 Tax=Asbolus verrucosus TaxID=1661398 RepID=A0A482W5W5_ASBVE|nr:guanylate kinase [Asbolus verrucosus]
MSVLQNPRPLVLCGPSGSGKSTLLKKMMEDFPNRFGFSISHTTRKPRPGEIDNQHYHFTNLDDMRRAIDEGKFIESATFCGNLYGTSKAAVDSVKRQGKVCVLDIDVQGVKQVKNTELNPWYIFIKPPSLDELKTRLTARKTESEESLQHRLKVAGQELEYGTEENFDFIVINDNLESAYAQLKAFLENQVLKPNEN